MSAFYALSLSLPLSLALPFSLLFLLPGYNGQTHNKEGKTRDRGTRYVGRLTMEHTWARAGAFERWLWGGRRYRMVHRYEMWGKRKKHGGTRRKAQGTEQCFQPLLRFLLLLLFNSGWCCSAPLLRSRSSENSGASVTLSDLFAKHEHWSLGTHVVVKQHGVIHLALSRVRKLPYSRVILLRNRSHNSGLEDVAYFHIWLIELSPAVHFGNNAYYHI